MSNDFAKKKLLENLVTEGISSSKVLDAIKKVPREKFVLQSLISSSYENKALPIEKNQTISQPFIVAYMTEQLKLMDYMKVLEIGTGSGYQAAILSQLVKSVYTIEIHEELFKIASKRFSKMSYKNIFLKHGNGSKGWDDNSQFDRIIITAALSKPSISLFSQLKNKGILLAPITDAFGEQYLVSFNKAGGKITKKTLLPVKFVPFLEN